MVERFTRLCSPCHLEDELKTLQNTFHVLGYPGCLISKVIAKSLSALKLIGRQKCQVYLKLPFRGVYKDVSPIQEKKVTSSKKLVVTVEVTMWEKYLKGFTYG